MLVKRAPLPFGVSVVFNQSRRVLILDSDLDRSQAALVVQGILPETHPDAVDHWLDQQYPRTRAHAGMQRMSALGVAFALVASLAAAHPGIHTRGPLHHLTRRRPAVTAPRLA